MAYPGNNIFLTPSYDVATVGHCRSLCRQEERCRYFTLDTETNWCYLKSEKNPRALSDEAGKTKYISGSGSPQCQTEEDNEISDSPSAPPPPPPPPPSGRWSPVLSVYDQQGDRTVLAALPATFGKSVDNKTEVRHLVIINYHKIYDNF